MEVPDEFYLYSIKESNAYQDKKSIEKATRKKGRKFKLACKPLLILETYSFLLIHSNDSACIKDLTLCVRRGDWEKRNPKHLHRLQYARSFIDINKCEVLTKEILLKKIKDRKNKFDYIAKLCNTKYRELKDLAIKLEHKKYIDRLSSEAKKILGPALDIPDKIKQKWGI